jgi:hypothetical protein
LSDPVVFTTLGDSLLLGQTNVLGSHEEPSLRGAIVEDASYGFVVAPPAALSNNPPFPLVIGVCKPGASSPAPSGGRAIVLTFPLGYTNPAPMDPRTPGVLLKILQLLGVTGP